MNESGKNENRIGVSVDLLFLVAGVLVYAFASGLPKAISAYLLGGLLASYVIMLLFVKNLSLRLLYYPEYARLFVVIPVLVLASVATRFFLPTVHGLQSLCLGCLFYLLTCTIAYDGMVWTPRLGKLRRDDNVVLFYCVLFLLSLISIFAIVGTTVYGVDFVALIQDKVPHRLFSFRLGGGT